MRLFIALDISEEAKKHLQESQKKLQTDNNKLTLAKNFHLTLKFLGEVTPAKAEEIKKRLQNITFKQFTAMLDGTGVFPDEKYIRVVWVGIEPSDIIKTLQQKIDNALEGLFPKEKEFQQHITLARVKNVKDKKQFAEHIKKISITPVSFEIKEFKLIESKLQGKEGPLYTDLEVYSAA